MSTGHCVVAGRSRRPRAPVAGRPRDEGAEADRLLDPSSWGDGHADADRAERPCESCGRRDGLWTADTATLPVLLRLCTFRSTGRAAESRVTRRCGLRTLDGGWDLRPHRSRVIHVNKGVLDTWHALLEPPETPVGQT